MKKKKKAKKVLKTSKTKKKVVKRKPLATKKVSEILEKVQTEPEQLPLPNFDTVAADSTIINEQ